jgi:hypothetical protein
LRNIDDASAFFILSVGQFLAFGLWSLVLVSDIAVLAAAA